MQTAVFKLRPEKMYNSSLSNQSLKLATPKWYYRDNNFGHRFPNSWRTQDFRKGGGQEI